jgi:hypothetical protein
MKNKKRHSLKLLSIVSAVIVSMLVQTNLVLADAEVTLTVKSPDPLTGNQSWFVYQRNPGQVIDDIASVKNFGDKEATVKIYPVDAISNNGGAFILKFDHEDQNGIGDWTEINQREITVKPDERIDIPFTITLPSDISPGQYLGGIVIEYGTADGSNDEKCKEGTPADCNGSVIAVKTRIGSRIYITVPGAVEENVDMTDFGFYLTFTGQTRFKFKLENKGNVAYQPEAQIEVRDASGKVYDTFTKSLGILMPNSTTEPSVSWDKKIPLIANYSATAKVTFTKKFQGAGESRHGAAITKDINFWVIPWNHIIYISLVILACATLCALRMLRFKKLVASSTIYEVAETDDLVSIAAQNHVNWKRLAKINKLRPPYIIKKGSTLFVPKHK